MKNEVKCKGLISVRMVYVHVIQLHYKYHKSMTNDKKNKGKISFFRKKNKNKDD